MTLEATWTMTLVVELGEFRSMGSTGRGQTTLISIVGGTVTGPDWSGHVLAGGADWNTVLPGDLTEFDARYNIQTVDGVVITIHNAGVVASDLGTSVIKTQTRFLVDRSSRYDHLRHGIHVGTLDVSEIDQGRVLVDVYRLP